MRVGYNFEGVKEYKLDVKINKDTKFKICGAVIKCEC